MKIVSFASQNPERQSELSGALHAIDAGIELKFAANEQEACELVEDADVLLVHKFTENLFLAAKRLRWVQITGAGVERSLFKDFVDSEITLTNSRGLHARPMAEWTLAALLYWAQDFASADKWRHDHEWKPRKKVMTENRVMLEGLNVLIVGFGEVGRGIAELLKSFGMFVEGVATHAREEIVSVYAMEQLEERLQEADVVVLTLPLTPTTRGLFNRRIFPLLKPGSVLVNVGRGALIDETDLIAALKAGKPAFAILDVFTEEPLPPDSKLYDVPNIFMTPHVSGNFPDYTKRYHEIFAENVARFRDGLPLRFVVDKKRGY
ncbi:MAG: D-2-hydroxyacid dehydrogenase [Calditrichaeota bacterium]|nr:D-2-hydroxyacid dehydrogenase [Calditrichota bacterium]MCB9368055.1 D-2-hydroxyacid dehydrogenase [Calditrichota bacterium]